MNKMTAVAAAAMIGLTALGSAPQQAEARRGGWGGGGPVAAGLIAGALIGSTDAYGSYYGPRTYYSTPAYYYGAPAYYGYGAYPRWRHRHHHWRRW